VDGVYHFSTSTQNLVPDSGENPVPYHSIVKFSVFVTNHSGGSIDGGNLWLKAKKANPVVPDFDDPTVYFYSGGVFNNSDPGLEYRLRLRDSADIHLEPGETQEVAAVYVQPDCPEQDHLYLRPTRSGVNEIHWKFMANSDEIVVEGTAHFEADLTHIEFDQPYVTLAELSTKDSEFVHKYEQLRDNYNGRHPPPSILMPASYADFHLSGWKAAVFWAVLHETQTGAWTTYRPFSDMPGVIEDPSSEGWAEGIARVVHDGYDYRYLEAQTIINGFLRSERTPTSGATENAFGYVSANFDATFGSESSGNPQLRLLRRGRSCAPTRANIGLSGSSIVMYDEVRQMVVNGLIAWEPALKWLEYYTACVLVNTNLQDDYDVRILEFFLGTIEQINGAVADLDSNCTPGDTSSIECDPTLGANRLVAASYNDGASSYADIAYGIEGEPFDPGNPVHVTAVQDAYNRHELDLKTDPPTSQHERYIPDFAPAVLQPVVGSWRDFANPPSYPWGQTSWHTVAHQRSDSAFNYPR
jgi:hypothetical protein